jgi:redox-sensitive bicupin YhaK (pirin superfamily)
MTTRTLTHVIESILTSDGAGVKLRRSLGSSQTLRHDPFLMLDEFYSDDPDDYLAGFPSHPHRGFETVTYMLDGHMLHQDNFGNRGNLGPGDVQWMTAAHGIIHSEMPQQTQGRMRGFQLWLNLPAKDKMTAPWYRDIPASEIPRFTLENGVTVQVIAGSSHQVDGAVQRGGTEPLYLDIAMPAGSTFTQALPPGHNAFAYVFRGKVLVDEKCVPEQRMAILANAPEADGVHITADSDSRLILIAGKPLNEPIAQYGPFVMNTQAELTQAVDDFRNGRF